MLNSKKTLLQRVRIAMIAIVAIMGIGGAFAMKAPAYRASATYGVLGQTTNHYIVTQNAVTAGDYSCDDSSVTCTILSPDTPVQDGSQWKIPKADATQNQTGNFRM